MKAKKINCLNIVLLFTLLLFFTLSSCSNKKMNPPLVFKDWPNLKIGLTTQNFQKVMPNSVENLTQIIEYASKEGYQFIELRDNLATLNAEDSYKSVRFRIF